MTGFPGLQRRPMEGSCRDARGSRGCNPRGGGGARPGAGGGRQSPLPADPCAGALQAGMEHCSLQLGALWAANTCTALWQTAYKAKSNNLRGADLAAALPRALSAGRQGSPGCPGKPTGAASHPAAPTPVPFPTCPAQPCAGSQPNKRPPSSSPALSPPWHSPSLPYPCLLTPWLQF